MALRSLWATADAGPHLSDWRVFPSLALTADPFGPAVVSFHLLASPTEHLSTRSAFFTAQPPSRLGETPEGFPSCALALGTWKPSSGCLWDDTSPEVLGRGPEADSPPPPRTALACCPGQGQAGVPEGTSLLWTPASKLVEKHKSFTGVFLTLTQTEILRTNEECCLTPPSREHSAAPVALRPRSHGLCWFFSVAGLVGPGWDGVGVYAHVTLSQCAGAPLAYV